MKLKKIKRHARLIVGAPVLLALILAACFSGWLAPADPNKIDTKNILKGPSSQHPFGNPIGPCVSIRFDLLLCGR